MRLILFILGTVLAGNLTAQTAAELQQHRLKYKTDLFNDIKADTSKVDFFPFNASFIITAKVELLENQPVFNFTTSSGMKKPAQKFARISFRYKGKEQVFYAYQLTKLKESAETADHFFIPFKDATTGKTTYAAGRYLDFKTSDINDGHLTIDFNKAYNPYCAFSDGYNCPIPPRENALSIKIEAGERKYLGEIVSRQ